MSYEDIIQHPHHVSKTRPQMSLHDRAAQFAPFAALTGHSAAISETARLTQEQADLDEEQILKLNEQLRILRRHLQESPKVRITYFRPDERKSGGSYQTVEGTIRKIDDYNRTILLTDETKIPMDALLSIEGDIFSR